MVQAIVKHKVSPNISIITQGTNNYIMGLIKETINTKTLSDKKTKKRKKDDQLENYAKGPAIFFR